jgi:hypothetical protein
VYYFNHYIELFFTFSKVNKYPLLISTLFHIKKVSVAIAFIFRVCATDPDLNAHGLFINLNSDSLGYMHAYRPCRCH